MRKTVDIFNVDTDVTAISCDVNRAAIKLVAAQGKALSVKIADSACVHAAVHEGELLIKQGRRPFSRFKKAAEIVIEVPGHTVPTLFFHGNFADVNLEGGIYSTLEYLADNGTLTLTDAAFESVEVKGDNVNLAAKQLTVKNNLVCNCDNGETVLENCFAGLIECRHKKGNIGGVNLSCKDSLYEADKGNISLTIPGTREDYKLSLLAKNGTCNCESDENESASYSLRAMTTEGNIVIDFKKTEKEENEIKWE